METTRVSNVGDQSRGNSLSPKTFCLVWPIKEESYLWIDVEKSFHSWIDEDNIIVDAMFPENFRFVILGPSECGKTFLLKHLFLNTIQFDRLYIIGPTGNQNDDLKYKDIMIIKDLKISSN